MPFVNLNGVKLYFKDEGDKEKHPIILLHGVTSHHRRFQKEIELFKEKFRVIALDSRGHGKSDKPISFTLDDHIQDVISLIDYLNLEKVHLLGVSMGSYIAQGVAINIPKRIDKLILIGSKAHGLTSSMSQLFFDHADEIKGKSFEKQMNDLSKYMFHNLRAVSRWLHDTADKSLELSPKQQRNARKALAGFDFRPNLFKIEAETLIISGRHDGLNPPDEGKEIAKRISNAKFMEFEQSGHAPHVEERERFNEVILEFLLEG